VAIALKKPPTGHETDLLDSTGPAKQRTGAGGKIQLNTFAVASLAINKTALPMTSIIVTDIKPVVEALKTAAGVDVSSVIGQDVLTTHADIIDLRGKTLFIKVAMPSPADVGAELTEQRRALNRGLPQS
jgi:hypothetical protein